MEKINNLKKYEYQLSASGLTPKSKTKYISASLGLLAIIILSIYILKKLIFTKVTKDTFFTDIKRILEKENANQEINDYIKEYYEEIDQVLLEEFSAFLRKNKGNITKRKVYNYLIQLTAQNLRASIIISKMSGVRIRQAYIDHKKQVLEKIISTLKY